jgi:ABC-type branched-subunit amino acid transport system substrate-binding protein
MTRRLALVALAAFAACEDGGTTTGEDTIKIALITPKSGALDVVGQSFERVALLAQTEINEQGGVNGRNIELMIVDDESNADFARPLLNAVVDLGAVAVVGPARSPSVINIVPVIKAREVPTISPSSTQQDITKLDDGGFLYRNVPNDGFQGLAMAYYLRVKRTPQVEHVLVVRERSTYGEGLAMLFTKAFTEAGGIVDDELDYPANVDDPENAGEAELAAQKIVAAAPTMVVMIALQKDGLRICQAWDAIRGEQQPEWFFTDGSRSSGFLDGLPDSILGAEGTAPTNPITGDAYGVLADRYFAAHGKDIGEEVYAANVWDAIFLIAAGLAQEEHDFPGEALGGARLRDAIAQVSHTGQISNAGQWRDLLGAIASGADVDYDGASGPCDFDEQGEAISAYEVWKIDKSNGMTQFVQTEFMEAQELQALLGM